MEINIRSKHGATKCHLILIVSERFSIFLYLRQKVSFKKRFHMIFIWTLMKKLKQIFLIYPAISDYAFEVQIKNLIVCLIIKQYSLVVKSSRENFNVGEPVTGFCDIWFHVGVLNVKVLKNK